MHARRRSLIEQRPAGYCRPLPYLTIRLMRAARKAIAGRTPPWRRSPWFARRRIEITSATSVGLKTAGSFAKAVLKPARGQASSFSSSIIEGHAVPSRSQRGSGCLASQVSLATPLRRYNRQDAKRPGQVVPGTASNSASGRAHTDRTFDPGQPAEPHGLSRAERRNGRARRH
jgi:hypothetical protein